MRRANEYCISIVKKHDYDSYLTGMLTPKRCRMAFYAVRAFNVEIATIKDNAMGNAMTGRIRIQWWRDIIENIYTSRDDSNSRQKISQHPVAESLAESVQLHGLSRHWFERSLDARQQDLYTNQYDSLEDLETYAEGSQSSMLYLLQETLGVDEEEASYAASHVGVACGLVTFLRALPHNTAQSKSLCIPTALCMKHGVPLGSFRRGDDAHVAALREATYDIASQANAHLHRGKELHAKSKNKSSVYALSGSATRSRLYLEDLRKNHFDAFSEALHQNQNSHLQFQLKTLWATMTRKI